MVAVDCGGTAAGVVWKASSRLRAPAPLPMPFPPAPVTRTEAAFRLVREGLPFEALVRVNRWTRLFGRLLHAVLLLVAVRHPWPFLDPAPVRKPTEGGSTPRG